MPIQRREISIFNTQTIDKIASSITAYDNALDKYKVFNKLTDNGTVEGIFMEDGELYVNGTWVAAGVLSDAQGKNAWNLETGDLAMTKGSISLGALSGGGYNFSVTDAGALTMKSGSITLGTSGQKPYFHVATTGALEWDLTNSSMSSTGVMSLTGATITGGTITNQDTNRKVEITSGSMNFYYNNSSVGWIGATTATLLGDPGPFITIGKTSGGGGFMIEDPPGSLNANQVAFFYDRTNDRWQIDRGLVINCDTRITDDVDVYGTLTVNDATVATQSWVQSQGYLTSHQSLSGYATQSWVQSQGYLTSHQSLSGYATQSWVNNQGYLTAVPDTYATKSWVSTNTPGKGISQTVYIKNPANNRDYELVFTGGTLQSYTAL